MKKISLYLLTGLLGVVACTQRGLPQDPNTLPVGELIEVTLGLPLEQPQAISRAEPTTTQWLGGGLDAQITATPLDQATSKAVEDKKIANVWVLQFDGSATTSVLRYKSYVAAYVEDSKVTLLKATTENRVAIIANSFSPTWGDSFALNSATWADVSAQSSAVATQSDLLHADGATEYLPMSGTVLTPTLAVGATLNVPLLRTVVKVTVNFKSGVDLNATSLEAQMRDVPNATSWFPNAVVGSFPAAPTGITYASQEVVDLTTTDYKSLTYWLPVNRRGVVDGTESFTRFTNAPTAATYLHVVAGGWVYTVHLGADFATDYNLNANTAYTYSLIFHTDLADIDSRVSDQRTLGTLVQDPMNDIAPEGAIVTITSPSAMAGLVWVGSTDPALGFDVGAFSGSGPTGSMPVVVGVNPTNAVRSSTFMATATNGQTASLALAQAASSLTSDTAPVAYAATSVAFTVTGTPGLLLSLAKTGGDPVFSDPSPATLICDGTAQRVTVTMPANTGAARQATYSATVTNAGAAGLSLTNITVKQEGPPINPPTVDDYVEINGLKWTKGNLVAKNNNECKVGASTDYGVYFQFGSLVGWSGGASGNGVGAGSLAGDKLDKAVWPAAMGATKPSYTWQYKDAANTSKLANYYFNYSVGPWATGGVNSDIGTFAVSVSGEGVSTGTLRGGRYANLGVGDPCRYYLGALWRTPTHAEHAALDAAGRGGWVTSPVTGRWFGPNPGTASRSVFFPAAGSRFDANGTLNHIGSYGFHWSSSVFDATNGHYLYFNSTNVFQENYNVRSYGLPVRCVSE